MPTVNDVKRKESSSTAGFFELVINSKNELALAEYQFINTSRGKVIEIPHTFVPVSERGRGLAGIVTEAAFQWAKENGWKVRPTCSYVSGRFLDKNPHWNDNCE
mmetsp:Transcript_742/g.916  ORF Transcript_742/g.916 Transcript_742/m.916 type:complete len:104 (-) Transcript_742:970-1281(-)